MTIQSARRAAAARQSMLAKAWAAMSRALNRAPAQIPPPPPKVVASTPHIDWIDEGRRMNYHHPMNFLAQTMENLTPFAELTSAQWEAKKEGWRKAGVFDKMYATTDQSLYGCMGPPVRGTMAGRSFAEVEAEVRRIIGQHLGYVL